jgi:phosphocarrier protein HPr
VNNKGGHATGKIVTLARQFQITNAMGMHARPAALFVKTASRFDSDITVEKDDMSVSGKSIMGLMTLEASIGTILKITATGLDAQEALDELHLLFEKKFFED